MQPVSQQLNRTQHASMPSTRQQVSQRQALKMHPNDADTADGAKHVHSRQVYDITAGQPEHSRLQHCQTRSSSPSTPHFLAQHLPAAHTSSAEPQATTFPSADAHSALHISVPDGTTFTACARSARKRKDQKHTPCCQETLRSSAATSTQRQQSRIVPMAAMCARHSAPLTTRWTLLRCPSWETLYGQSSRTTQHGLLRCATHLSSPVKHATAMH